MRSSSADAACGGEALRPVLGVELKGGVPMITRTVRKQANRDEDDDVWEVLAEQREDDQEDEDDEEDEDDDDDW